MASTAAKEEQLSKTFAALSDPTRRKILSRLSHGESTVSELAEPFLRDMSLPAVTKHLKVLERAGLITKSREAQWRPCKLNGDTLHQASAWLEHYRVFWEESFDRLEAYLKATAPPEKPSTPPKRTQRKSRKGKGHGRQQ